MNTQNTNNNPAPKKSPNDGVYHAVIMLYLTINGIATGKVIRNVINMTEHGYNREKMIVMMLWLLLVIYSTQRIYEVNRNRKNRNNNKTR